MRDAVLGGTGVALGAADNTVVVADGLAPVDGIGVANADGVEVRTADGVHVGTDVGRIVGVQAEAGATTGTEDMAFPGDGGDVTAITIGDPNPVGFKQLGADGCTHCLLLHTAPGSQQSDALMHGLAKLDTHPVEALR